MVSMELNSSKLITLMLEDEKPPLCKGSPSFIHMRDSGESPRATVQVNVVLSPCCKLDGAENGTTFGATAKCNGILRYFFCSNSATFAPQSS